MCLDNGKTYNSLREASRMTGVKQESITRQLKRKNENKSVRKTYNGKRLLSFVVVGDYELQHNGIPCKRIEDGKVFCSMSDAAREVGCSPSYMMKSIAAHRMVRGYTYIKLMNCEFRR